MRDNLILHFLWIYAIQKTSWDPEVELGEANATFVVFLLVRPSALSLSII